MTTKRVLPIDPTAANAAAGHAPFRGGNVALELVPPRTVEPAGERRERIASARLPRGVVVGVLLAVPCWAVLVALLPR
jgi:hypothetical protein